MILKLICFRLFLTLISSIYHFCEFVNFNFVRHYATNGQFEIICVCRLCRQSCSHTGGFQIDSFDILLKSDHPKSSLDDFMLFHRKTSNHYVSYHQDQHYISSFVFLDIHHDISILIQDEMMSLKMKCHLWWPLHFEGIIVFRVNTNSSNLFCRCKILF